MGGRRDGGNGSIGIGASASALAITRASTCKDWYPCPYVFFRSVRVAHVTFNYDMRYSYEDLCPSFTKRQMSPLKLNHHGTTSLLAPCSSVAETPPRTSTDLLAYMWDQHHVVKLAVIIVEGCTDRFTASCFIPCKSDGVTLLFRYRRKGAPCSAGSAGGSGPASVRLDRTGVDVLGCDGRGGIGAGDDAAVSGGA